MDQFDYWVLDVDAEDLETHLKGIGREGWDLVTVLPFGEPFDDIVYGHRVTGLDLRYRLVLKRTLVNVN